MFISTPNSTWGRLLSGIPVNVLFQGCSDYFNQFGEFLTSVGSLASVRQNRVSGAEGGANIFKLDYFGRDAYLAQSPQFYKQMMVGVYVRSFETGPVFRAEKHDTSRHLNEYISLDFEMGFIDSFYDLIKVEANLLNSIFWKTENNMS